MSIIQLQCQDLSLTNGEVFYSRYYHIIIRDQHKISHPLFILKTALINARKKFLETEKVFTILWSALHLYITHIILEYIMVNLSQATIFNTEYLKFNQPDWNLQLKLFNIRHSVGKPRNVLINLVFQTSNSTI